MLVEIKKGMIKSIPFLTVCKALLLKFNPLRQNAAHWRHSGVQTPFSNYRIPPFIQSVIRSNMPRHIGHKVLHQ